MKEGIGILCRWSIYEIVNGKRVKVVEKKNTFTDYGLTALASAPGLGYTPPLYLVIDTNKTTLAAGVSTGDTTIQTVARVDLGSDTQLVLSVGLAAQEVVTFSGVTGSGPYIYTLSSPAANNHAISDPVVRQVLQADDNSTIVTELEYDHTNFPSQRLAMISSYSTGIGSLTMQWYFTATQAIGYFSTLGLSDNPLTSLPNLHNHVNIGYDHSAGLNDVEIDAVITLTNT